MRLLLPTTLLMASLLVASARASSAPGSPIRFEDLGYPYTGAQIPAGAISKGPDGEVNVKFPRQPGTTSSNTAWMPGWLAKARREERTKALQSEMAIEEGPSPSSARKKKGFMGRAKDGLKNTFRRKGKGKHSTRS
ncbi:hypothetical protein BCV69DRAFT_769 [Microstroma glucosiphilum]|uniref:Uncharacterized protein n=1 Tax=Pseudomicrostroma glucosiphilum TaxID=1684307 RepID=A0A316UE88_9BASI|nr:hypothetical protein BCV69DRAFT_769 [Pseudomicrostroma glucosiphilum]PWN23502.1 hypothetical protein BCV69DRAFT_769 [Pseudomicrostroma glucosiphilum]